MPLGLGGDNFDVDSTEGVTNKSRDQTIILASSELVGGLKYVSFYLKDVELGMDHKPIIKSHSTITLTSPSLHNIIDITLKMTWLKRNLIIMLYMLLLYCIFVMNILNLTRTPRVGCVASRQHLIKGV